MVHTRTMLFPWCLLCQWGVVMALSKERMLQHLQRSLCCRIEISKKKQKKKQDFSPALIVLMEVVMVPAPCFVYLFSQQSLYEWVVGGSGGGKVGSSMITKWMHTTWSHVINPVDWTKCKTQMVAIVMWLTGSTLFMVGIWSDSTQKLVRLRYD